MTDQLKVIPPDSNHYYIDEFLPWSELETECRELILRTAYQQFWQWEARPPFSPEVNPKLLGFTWRVNLEHGEVHVFPVYLNSTTGQLSAEKVGEKELTSWAVNKENVSFFDEEILQSLEAHLTSKLEPLVRE